MKMTDFRQVRLLWALPLLFATACNVPAGGDKARPSKETAAPARAAVPKACMLLSAAEAEAIVGEPVRQAQMGPEPSYPPHISSSQCVYATSDGGKSLGVLVRHSSNGDNAPAYARKTMADSGLKVEDVAGVGDAAFWAGVQVQAFKGANDQVIVTVMGFDPAKDKAVAAAKKVIDKL